MFISIRENKKKYGINNKKIKIKLELKKINCFLEISTYNVMGAKENRLYNFRGGKSIKSEVN